MSKPINIENLPYVESLYRKYLAEPASINDAWRDYFSQASGNGELPRAPRVPMPPARSEAPLENNRDGNREANNNKDKPGYAAGVHSFNAILPTQLNDMIHAYRAYGHLNARVDPLNRRTPGEMNLRPEAFDFLDSHLDKLVASEAVHFGAPLTLREFVQRLEEIYCGTIGFEFMHIADRSARTWLQERIERAEKRAGLDPADQIRILSRLIDAQTFEQFIRKKFLGAKSFSLEGAESLIPLLEFAIEKAAAQGVAEIVLAMAHRGRLSVLANILGKRPRDIFREFIDPSVAHADGSGDVKYHLGHSHDYLTRGGQPVHLSLCFNPSHLEFVNPVALGRARAKQDRSEDSDRSRTMAFLIHGDAALAGEGISQETLNLSRLSPYYVGGALHVVLNNQIGFTTPPVAARSTVYATDVAKMLQIPIFHVNGDEPESVIHAVRLGMEFRVAFRQDVMIDLYCYRRLGHNEGDEPSFTQPRLYQAIAKQKNIRELYGQRLLSRTSVTASQAAELAASFTRRLEQEFSAARDERQAPVREELQGVWADYCGGPEENAQEITSTIAPERATRLLELQTQLPEGFRPHPKMMRAMEARRKMAAGKMPLDWSAAESLALASLAADGVRIRLTGQDSGRGTFSQRHAVLRDYQDGHEYVPLQHVARDQAPVEIYDSPLSEAAALGFEYGYSLDCPGGLTLWEAQFGDFSNAAQVIIDQFITTAEEKWRRLSGLVMLLPHGFEGMGPEHSSARLERFLQLGARDNIQVVYPTTPAQYFHCLRRHALRKWRKPLVVMTPKSLLRHPHSVSSLGEFSAGEFQPAIADMSDDYSHANSVILCSGKIYYDLERKRQEQKRAALPIIRIEQLYPFPQKQLRAALDRYAPQAHLLWVQEEPENMGAWWYLNFKFAGKLRRSLSVVARPSSASPATGSATRHREQQEQLLDKALACA